MDDRQRQRDAGHRRAAALLGKPPREFRSAAQIEGARRAIALSGTKALREFDEQYRRDAVKSFDRSRASTFRHTLREGDRDRDGRPMAKEKLFSLDHGNRLIPIVMGGARVGEVTSTRSYFGDDRRMALEISGVANEPARTAMSKRGYCFVQDGAKLSLEICD
jgi:hypothetical protein